MESSSQDLHLIPFDLQSKHYSHFATSSLHLPKVSSEPRLLKQKYQTQGGLWTTDVNFSQFWRQKWPRGRFRWGPTSWVVDSYPLPVTSSGGRDWNILSGLFHNTPDYFYKRKTGISAWPLSEPHCSTRRVERLRRQWGAKNRMNLLMDSDGWSGGPWQGQDQKDRLAGTCCNCAWGPCACQPLKALWAPPPMKSQLDAGAVFLTLTRSVIKRYWSLTLSLSLQATLAEVRGHTTRPHRLLGPSFCSTGLTGMMGKHPLGPWRPYKKPANHGL